VNRLYLLFGLLGLFASLSVVKDTRAQENAPEWDGTLRRIHAQILMYHYVGYPPADADRVRRNLTVTTDNFRAQMQQLQTQGYHPISLYELNDALITGATLPANPVILTFDDGYIEHYTTVFPILQEFGFTATFFIITGRIDDGDPNYITWAQVSEMAAAGMTMESHTITHSELDERDYDFLVYELLGSLQTLEAYTGQPVRMLAYPAGRYDENTLSVVATTPLWRALTTETGTLHTTDNRFEMARVRISFDTTLATFTRILQSR
jgi:peptidoglycan/xylan/chitin deacetylase (PgdA/CDA1 family)